MKKLVASVGLVALGASGLQMASAQDLGAPDASKPWSVSATLRGFYDDNPATVANNVSVQHRDSFGFEVEPSATLKWAMEQTTINIGVLYSLKYYDTKPVNSTSHTDQAFTFDIGINHTFSEQVKVSVADSFVIGQEPDLLRAGNAFATFQRVSGDNIRNYASLALDAQLTPVFGMGFGYDNALYDYKNSGASFDPVTLAIIPSLSGVLDRMEHRAHIEGFYNLTPETKLLLGYRFMEIDYNSDEPVSGFAFFGPIITANQRNSREHSVYVGAQHEFSPNLTGAIRAGGSFTDYYNDDFTDNSYTPYVNATLKYAYAPGSFVEGGVSYDRNATDVVGMLSSGGYTVDAESAVVFVNVKHQLDPRLFLGFMGQFQNSDYKGGAFNSSSEQYYLAGLDLEYKFNQFFSGHIGYNYDRLESDLNRTFDRNRVYIGVTATY